MRQTILLIMFSCITLAGKSQSIEETVKRQCSQYPQSRLLDIYKSCFQDWMGAEHLLSDTASVRHYLNTELLSIHTDSLMSWYQEPCGIEGQHVRISLRAVKEGLISAEQLFDAFIRSANETQRPSVEMWKEQWEKIIKTIDSLCLDLPHYEEDRQFIATILAEGKYAISHSPQYRNAYHPHYRIIRRDIFEQELLPLLKKGKH